MKREAEEEEEGGRHAEDMKAKVKKDVCLCVSVLLPQISL